MIGVLPPSNEGLGWVFAPITGLNDLAVELSSYLPKFLATPIQRTVGAVNYALVKYQNSEKGFELPLEQVMIDKLFLRPD